jgi:hypothetical protein
MYVSAILTLIDVVAIDAVAGIFDLITRTILRLHDIAGTMNHRSTERLELPLRLFPVSERTPELRDTRFKLVFCTLAILDAVLLLHEVRAKKAVFAPDEIHGEQTILAVFTEREMCAVVRMVDRETLVAELTPVEVGTIDGVSALLEKFPVIAILCVLRGIDEIAVPAVPSTCREIAVLIAHDSKSHARNRFVKICELFEERTRPVDVSAELTEIIPVIVPLIIRTDLVRLPPERLLMNERNDLLAGNA